MIYHIVAKHNWDIALQEGFYEAASLSTEGFIHSSKAEQVEGVLKDIIKTRQIFYYYTSMKAN